MLALKEYQQRALDVLREYCRLAVQLGDADTAFYQLSGRIYGTRMRYNNVAELPGLPYVCLRVPTGGGKTLLACHAVPILKQELLHDDHPLVLWLVPSNTIREQTLAALRDRGHSYRQALETGLGAITVLDVADALHVQRATLDGGTTILVATIQAFRVEDTEGRKVYETNGALMGHFDGYPPAALEKLDKLENGQPIYSLANVIRLRRPLVLVDEAHNARTPLSFTTLARLAPSAIVELTATPDTQQNPSNVLYTVSAAELRAEDMIKMPILLETQPDWRKLLADAIAQLDQLEQEAQAEQAATGEYIRPIMLLQAQNRSSSRETITVEKLEETLVNEFLIPIEQIRRATGEERGLDGVDILAPGPIRYVITVQALREGWDCPFAYILCSVAEMSSSTAVEQLLGRIMRLPYARRKERDALNQAYAFAASNSFAATANALADGLVQNGFERQEVRDLIVARPATEQLNLGFGPLFDRAAVVDIPIPSREVPDLEQLPPTLADKVKVDPDSGTVAFQGWMSQEERAALRAAYNSEEGRQAVDQAFELSQRHDPRTPAERGVPFTIPVLAYRQGSLLEELDETHFLEHPWRLSQQEARLSEAELSSNRPTGQQAIITVGETSGRVEVAFLQTLHQQTDLLATGRGWSAAELIYWLDRQIPHPDIVKAESDAFLTKLVLNLQQRPGVTLDTLVHDKYRLVEAAGKKIDEYRQQARNQVYQQLLLPDSPLTVTPELTFTYDRLRYPYNRPYQGNYKFNKHYYFPVGDLKATGEEFECARFLDTLDEVDCWVRNPVRSSLAFSLQTSTDRFYPDFVCKLKDGRYLVVEYKGEGYMTMDDSREKNILGEIWERRSEGSCLFIMVTESNFEAIRAKIAPRH